jgi:hypothetical protein
MTALISMKCDKLIPYHNDDNVIRDSNRERGFCWNPGFSTSGEVVAELFVVA